jgi:arsenite methyltransferase
MSITDGQDIRNDVRRHYAERARDSSACCGGTATEAACCGTSPDLLARGARMGYDAEELSAVPEAAAMSFGCGNPRAIAGLKPGEVVLDLGSGGGFDCFLAAREVGTTGRVIGVDMTPEMIERARANAARGGYEQVEFRLGEIEHLPVADASVDVVISNCVINLAPDKRAVYADAYRVLKPGGRLAIADTVATIPVPEEARRDPELWSACASGSLEIGELERVLSGVGFTQVRIAPKDESREMIREWVPGTNIHDYVLSATIEAVKPG